MTSAPADKASASKRKPQVEGPAEMVRLNVILDSHLYRRLQQHAFDRRETVSAIIRRLISDELSTKDQS